VSTGVEAAGWTFLNQAGIASNGSAWEGTTTYGSYYAFLQSGSGAANASISQEITLTSASDLTISFAMAERSAYNSGGFQTVLVYLDGVVLNAGGTAFSLDNWDTWATFSVTGSDVSAGTHTLSFVGTNASASDSAAFIDNVSMTLAAVPEPSIYAMLLAGLGMLGVIVRRRA
jgi:hypothetical protein